MGVKYHPRHTVEAGYLPTEPVTIVNAGYCVFDFKKPGNEMPCLFADIYEDGGDRIRREYYSVMGGRKGLETFAPSHSGKHGDPAFNDRTGQWEDAKFLCTMGNESAQPFTDAECTIFFEELFNASPSMGKRLEDAEDASLIIGTRGVMSNHVKEFIRKSDSEKGAAGTKGTREIRVISKVLEEGKGKLTGKVAEIVAKLRAGGAEPSSEAPADSTSEAPEAAKPKAAAAGNSDGDVDIPPEALEVFESIFEGETGKPLGKKERMKLAFAKAAGGDKGFRTLCRNLAVSKEAMQELTELGSFKYDPEADTLELTA